jgi:hypothetical protein
MRVGGHRDRNLHRHGRSAAGERDAAGRLQLLECHRHDGGDGQPTVLAEIAGGQKRTHGGLDGIVVALSGGSCVACRCEHVGLTVDCRKRVGGVAHARSGQFREHDFHVGARLRIQTECAAAHAVGLLWPKLESAAGGTTALARDRIVAGGVVLGQQQRRFSA